MRHRQIAHALATTLLFLAAAHAQVSPNAKAVYDASCAACHSTGAAGAPRLGDSAAWSDRLSRGMNALIAGAIKGKGAMPPKGGNASLTDAQVIAATQYMVGTNASPGSAAPPARPGVRPAESPKAGAPGAGDAAKGRLVYQASCAACHSSGLAGAPKPGDASAWTARLAGGVEPMYASAIRGKGAMPPKGGNASLSDADLRAAVDYMLVQLRSDLPAKTVAVVSAPAASSLAANTTAQPAAAQEPAVQEATDPNAFNRLMMAPTRRNRSPSEDGIHDPASPGTALLQAPLRSFQSLPRNNVGNYVDWVAALGNKKIQPRWDVRDPKAQATVMDLTIIREVKGSMQDVVFPHKQHTEWLDCSNCHPAIFTPQKGSNQISMAAIMLGQKCGICHGKVAFPISECRLCHARQKTAEARPSDAGPAGGKQ